MNLNGTNYLYYAVSTFGSQVSGIGLVTTTNLLGGPWVDQGPVILSTNGSAYNCIDPCPLIDTNGAMWMTFGSFWNGIYLVQLDPTTGKRISPTSTTTRLAFNSSIEGSFLYQRGGYYYLFVNWGSCCEGIDSTYNIRVGRSTTVTGPYFDRKGVSHGRQWRNDVARKHCAICRTRPGRHHERQRHELVHLSLLRWQQWRDCNARPGSIELERGRLAGFDERLERLLSASTGRSRASRDSTTACCINGATITNDGLRGNVLSLDGVSQYVQLPDSIANCSTITAWVKWHGGADLAARLRFWHQHRNYFYLTPRASTGKYAFRDHDHRRRRRTDH